MEIIVAWEFRVRERADCNGGGGGCRCYLLLLLLLIGGEGRHAPPRRKRAEGASDASNLRSI